jgi:hypothetical protein
MYTRVICTRAAITLVAGFSLAACTTDTNVSSLGPGDRLLPRVAEAPEPLPPEAYLDGTAPVSPVYVAARPSRRPVRSVQSVAAAQAKVRTDGISSAAKSSEPAAFSPEWWERENREDQRLKKKMHICQGC